jgi:hypothetical protein
MTTRVKQQSVGADTTGMRSSAWLEWERKRAQRIDELIAAHGKVEGPGRGRRWRTEQLHWALILKLAAEFQGFALDLHDLAVRTFASNVAPNNKRVEMIVRTTLQRGRLLASENANKSSLCKDFDRIGLKLAARLQARDRRSDDRLNKLDKLNQARNAIAHDNTEKFAELHAAGYRLNLADAKKWRSALNALAWHLDNVVADHLAVIFRAEQTLW